MGAKLPDARYPHSCLRSFAQAFGQSAPGVKFFAASDVLELTKDRSWLAKMTNAINQHWRDQNVRRKGRGVTLNGATQAAETFSAA